MYFEENSFCLTGDVLDDVFLCEFEQWYGPSATRLRHINIVERFTARKGGSCCCCTARYTLGMTDQGHISMQEKEFKIEPWKPVRAVPACGCRLRRFLGYWNERTGPPDEVVFEGQDSPLAFLRYLAQQSEDRRPRKKGKLVRYGSLWGLYTAPSQMYGAVNAVEGSARRAKAGLSEAYEPEVCRVDLLIQRGRRVALWVPLRGICMQMHGGFTTSGNNCVATLLYHVNIHRTFSDPNLAFSFHFTSTCL